MILYMNIIFQQTSFIRSISELRDVIFYGTDMKFINQMTCEANWTSVSRTSA